MKKILNITLALLIAFSLSACKKTNNDNKVDNVNNNQNNKNITVSSNLDDFQGKPSVLYFGGTFCPHCVTGVPIVKAKVYDQYKDKINVWVNVVDGQDGSKFKIDEIPQGYNSKLVFNDIVGEKCGYVPSWILLDKDAKVVLYSCGSERPIEEMIAKIQELLK